jgi:hypothetical protein
MWLCDSYLAQKAAIQPLNIHLDIAHSQSCPAHCLSVIEIGVCRQEGRAPPQDPSQEVFLAFGRVFSGVLKDGQSVHVLSAAYNPAQPHLQRQIHQV